MVWKFNCYWLLLFLNTFTSRFNKSIMKIACCWWILALHQTKCHQAFFMLYQYNIKLSFRPLEVATKNHFFIKWKKNSLRYVLFAAQNIFNYSKNSLRWWWQQVERKLIIAINISWKLYWLAKLIRYIVQHWHNKR